MVEFALIAMTLLFFFLGTVDFARFMYYSDAISSAARAGADVASNHCPYAGYACGTTDQGPAVTDDYVIWATYCDAQPAVNLNLGQYATGKTNTTPVSTFAYTTTTSSSNATLQPCQPDDTSSTWVPACNTSKGATCTSCANDICVAPANRTSSGTDVSVSVGYDFQPITPLMNRFFATKLCWSTSDSPAPPQSDSAANQHTLCARAVGKVY